MRCMNIHQTVYSCKNRPQHPSAAVRNFYPILGIKNRTLRPGFSNQNLLTPCPCENSTASRPPRGITIHLASSRRTLLMDTDRNQRLPHRLAQSLKELSQVQYSCVSLLFYFLALGLFQSAVEIVPWANCFEYHLKQSTLGKSLWYP